MSKREDNYAHQNTLSSKEYRVLFSRFEKPGIEFSKQRKGFNRHDMPMVLQTMSHSKRFAESVSRDLKKDRFEKQKNGESVPGIPSGSWMMKKPRKLDPARADRWCGGNVNCIPRRARREGLARSGCTVAADVSGPGHYGDSLGERMRTSKPRNGTSKFPSHLTLHTVSRDYNIPLDAKTVLNGDRAVTSLLQMPKKPGRRGPAVGAVLADREFFSAAAINGLQDGGRKFLMPAAKNARVKKAITEVDAGTRGAASRFHITGTRTKEKAPFNLLVVRRDGCDKDAPITDQCAAFATNLPVCTRKELADVLPEEYRRRWIVETGFRTIKDVLAKTCSRRLHVRRILFYFALLSYGLWRPGQYYDLRHGNLAGGKSFAIVSFVKCMATAAEQLIKWEKHHGNFKWQIP
ncbi:MAG: transposase [Thaumarchaeota archaeon]|nr:transposase [Nitrososphaerota archaeon]